MIHKNDSIKTHKNDRYNLLNAISNMSEESFGWIVSSCMTGIFPSGLGGFSTESKESIENLRKAATKYVEEYK